MAALEIRVQCGDCGAFWTEIYPDGLGGDESYSSPDDPKPCACESQYELQGEARESEPARGRRNADDGTPWTHQLGYGKTKGEDG
jgi:hypothetical protein